ncbi:MAG: bifunctional oligoribonuclease/PAP phosphatase NrnA [Syntrophales bacterium]|nr:bifunctional oligoribonuclease/PAP phosphatase NrnA [Syntrophales bacterium]
MIQKIAECIHQGTRFLITSHVRLDGDALGSELALYHFLKRKGKQVVVFNEDPTPANYRFLPGSEVIVNEIEGVDGFDVLFVLDCGDLRRVGRLAKKIGNDITIVNIDHHVSNGGFCQISWVDPSASSTGELILKLIMGMGGTVTEEIATNIYTAILTDTGGFRYGNTTSEVFKAVSFLVEKGANPQFIAQRVYESHPLEKLLLLAKVVQTLEFALNGKVGMMLVRQKDFEETGALPELTEGFVDLPRTVDSVVVSVLFTELSVNEFKVSLRSKDMYDVESVARIFGGGGHLNAAACRIVGSYEYVRGELLKHLTGIITQ